jgi:hypothetical protein
MYLFQDAGTKVMLSLDFCKSLKKKLFTKSREGIFPFGILREPALPYSFFLIENFLDAP